MKVYAFQSTGPVELDTQQLLDTPSSGNRIGWGQNSELPPIGGYWKRGDKLFARDTGVTWTCTGDGVGDADAIFVSDVPVVATGGRLTFNGTSVIQNSGNLGAVTDLTGGVYELPFGIPYLDDNYMLVGNVIGAGNGVISITAKAADKVTITRYVAGVATTGAFEVVLFR